MVLFNGIRIGALESTEGEEVDRIVDLDNGFVLGEGLLDLVGDTGVDGNDIVVLAEANDGELLCRELDAILVVDEVDDGV